MIDNTMLLNSMPFIITTTPEGNIIYSELKIMKEACNFFIYKDQIIKDQVFKSARTEYFTTTGN